MKTIFFSVNYFVETVILFLILFLFNFLFID